VIVLETLQLGIRENFDVCISFFKSFTADAFFLSKRGAACTLFVICILFKTGRCMLMVWSNLPTVC
jgi:hypothetical protein